MFLYGLVGFTNLSLLCFNQRFFSGAITFLRDQTQNFCGGQEKNLTLMECLDSGALSPGGSFRHVGGLV